MLPTFRIDAYWYGSGSAGPYHNITDPDPVLSSVAFKMPTKNKFFYNFFFYTFCRIISISLKDKQVTRTKSHKTVEINVLSIWLLVDGRIWIREAHKLMDPTDWDQYPDPDLEHWMVLFIV